MPSIVTYNGITLNSVLTTRFEQHPIYDPSGTDVIASKFAMTFEGVCHAQGISRDPTLPWIAAGGSSGTLPSVQQAYTAIAQSLWAPRQKLTVSMGGAMLFVCNPADSGTQYDDVENGPKPRNVALSHITSNATIGPTFHVTFEIECVRPCCASGGIRDVLNNRWSIAEGFDDEYYTLRTITGQIRLSSSQLAADAYRYLVVPTLEKGFKRDSLHWNIRNDGLVIDYVVSDKQIETAPPWPAAKMNVRHSESTATGNHFESDCHVTLHGYPGADKTALFALAIRILENRIAPIKSMPGSNGMVPVAFAMVDTIGERNELEVYLKVQHTINVADNDISVAANYIGTPVGTIGLPLDDPARLRKAPLAPVAPGYPPTYNSNSTPEPNPWGYNTDGSTRTSAITRLVMQCFCQGPCNDNHWIYQSSSEGQPGTTDPPKPPAKTDTQVYDSPSLPDYQAGSAKSLQSTAGQQSLFTHAAAETILAINPLRAQMPIADDPAKYKAGSDTCVFVTLGLPQATITFHVEAERVGDWPAVPQPVPTFKDSATGMKGSLISAVLTPMPPTTDACAIKPIYHVSARITYGLNRPPASYEKIPIGVLQWTNYTPDKTALQLSTLYDASVQPVTVSQPSSKGSPY